MVIIHMSYTINLLLSSIKFKFLLYLYNSPLETTKMLGQIRIGPTDLFLKFTVSAN